VYPKQFYYLNIRNFALTLQVLGVFYSQPEELSRRVRNDSSTVELFINKMCYLLSFCFAILQYLKISDVLHLLRTYNGNNYISARYA